MIKTASDVKNLINDSENVKVMQTLFAAMAYESAVRAVIVPKQREILAFYKFPPCTKMQEIRGNSDPILEPRHSYMLSDEDFKLYDKEMQSFHKEAGFKVNEGCCPLLVAESLTRNARRIVADFFKPYFGFGYDQLITGRLSETADKYFDLLLQMFAGKVKELEAKEPFLKAA